jgi:hypothetical protein
LDEAFLGWEGGVEVGTVFYNVFQHRLSETKKTLKHKFISLGFDDLHLIVTSQ